MEKRIQAYEFFVVLVLIVPSMVIALFVTIPTNINFDLIAWQTIFQDVSLVVLLSYFMWRNREPVEQLGWNFTHVWKEIGIGILLFLAMFVIVILLEKLLLKAGLHGQAPKKLEFLHPEGAGKKLLATLLAGIVAFSEETIFRGYMLLRLIALTKSPTFAVIFSSFIFSIGHAYEGSLAMVVVGLMGALFAVIYLWRKSLVAPMTMHFLQDFIFLVL